MWVIKDASLKFPIALIYSPLYILGRVIFPYKEFLYFSLRLTTQSVELTLLFELLLELRPFVNSKYSKLEATSLTSSTL